jgi:hypothetical protein
MKKTFVITVHCPEKCIEQQELDSTETSSKLQDLFSSHSGNASQGLSQSSMNLVI